MLYKPYHVFPKVLGLKTMTRRCWGYPLVKPGHIYKAKTKMMSPEYFGIEMVLSVRKEPLGAMTDADADLEGGYSLDEFRALWEVINHVPWDPNLKVYVIRTRFRTNFEFFDYEKYEEFRIMYEDHKENISDILSFRGVSKKLEKCDNRLRPGP